MITILKGKEITVEWKVVSLDTKQPVDFEGVNAKVFLLAPDNIYTLPFDVVRDDFRGLRMTIPTGYISTGVYDLKVIWLKDALKDKPVYRNVSVKREVFALTDEVSEVTYEGDTIKIATGVESCGRDGLSAYEIAVFRGFAKESSEKEWVESLDNVLASEESRVEAEEKRVKAEDDRIKGEDLRIQMFTNGEQDRRQSFEISQSNRDTEFQNFLYNKEQSYITAENNRDSSYYNRELLRDGKFETEESARNTQFLNKEQERNKAEEDRKKAEEDRKSTFEENEANRQFTFQSNEGRREEKETLRGIEEGKRDNAETIRKENETKRVDAEISREERTAAAIASIANKVDREDNAPKLTAGFANNLVGRGEATPQEISFRPSGGDTSIEDGTARIDMVKGSTVVWNQYVRHNASPVELRGVTFTYDEQDNCFVINGTATQDFTYYGTSYGSRSIPLGRKAYGMIKVLAGDTLPDVRIGSPFKLVGNYMEKISVVTDDSHYPQIRAKGGVTYDNVRIQIVSIDLTQMFGAGNEPITIEEFNARKPINIDEYAYNEGELISNNVDEIKSVGFNAWDEEWEQGSINLDGTLIKELHRIRTKNPIRVIPSAIYNVESGGKTIGFRFYDKDDNHLGRDSNRNTKGGTIIIPTNAYYMRFSVVDTATYNNDICINLSHTGYRNGEYEPYKEFRRSIPVKGIKDNDGNQLFPNGLLSAGSVHDEITEKKAIKRIGVVDMGSIIWNERSDIQGLRVSANALTSDSGNRLDGIISSAYPVDRLEAINDTFGDKTMKRNAGKILVRDTSYTDAAAFKAAMQGVMLYYELAEPIEVDLPEPLNLDYEVSDFGTEEVISDVPTTPMKADIIYQFNAVDRIRDNSRHTADADKKLLDYESRIKALEAIVASLTSSES